jgi:DUF4097 and DUF4098 domain-containing protein YvlB
MKRHRGVATWSGAILGAVCALLVAVPAHATDHSRDFTEEFHHTYPLAAGGRVELDNINGAVHITAWDRDEVKVDGVKYAGTQERMDEAKIEVEADKDRVSIRTKYREHDQTFNNWDRNNPASVEYTLTVPRAARLDEIKLINGSLDLTGMTGEVRASCINGRIRANGLQGRVELSIINGPTEAQFERLADSPLELSSINGSVELTIPSDAKAQIEASTVHGGIDNEFGLKVHNHQWVGHDMRGNLGGGGTRITLRNVNGPIQVRHASDGRALSPGKDLDPHRDGDDDEI